MSSVHAITNVVDDSTRDELALFDDDDPFNLPPPLPPLSPQREDDGTNQDGDGAQGDQEAGEGDKKDANKKRKVKRSPRPKLDEVRLCGNRGIPALSHLCDDIKFKGKGHEASDLKLLVQRYEYWAHRLFPKFPFADVVDQVENLGSKKLVQNCIKRIRRGEEDTVEDEGRSDTELAQNSESQDDGLLSQVPATPVNNVQAFGVQMEARDQMVILTPEQQERIRLNRERALARRKAALEKQAEQDNTQTDVQTSPTEEAIQSNDDTGIAKEDDDTARNLPEMENDSSVQANDVDMEDDIVDRNVRSSNDNEQESLNGAQTNVDNVESTSVACEKDSVEQEDIEMANADMLAVDSVTDVLQKEDNVPEAGNTNINEITEENDLLGSVKDLAPNEDDVDLATAPLMEETPSSSRNDEALHQEGPQETIHAPPTEQAPGENEPGEAQNAKMDTEQ
ncbi:hypothetical protein ACROYT_G001683 [Oculina patagonica]